MKGRIGRKNVAQLVQLTTNLPLCSRKTPLEVASLICSALRIVLRACDCVTICGKPRAVARGSRHDLWCIEVHRRNPSHCLAESFQGRIVSSWTMIGDM